MWRRCRGGPWDGIGICPGLSAPGGRKDAGGSRRGDKDGIGFRLVGATPSRSKGELEIGAQVFPGTEEKNTPTLYGKRMS